MMAEKIENNVFRILVPFEDLTTTVYVYQCDDGVAIIDSATYGTDVDEYILPALKKLGIPLSQVKYLLLTHDHGDHSGGIERLREVLPEACVMTSYGMGMKVSDGQRIIGDLAALHLPGHTAHAMGYFDTKSKTLLSGDCLQLKGIGKYRQGVGDKSAYVSTVKRLKAMDIYRIVAAHEYDPLGSIAEGKENVLNYLDKCIEYAE